MGDLHNLENMLRDYVVWNVDLMMRNADFREFLDAKGPCYTDSKLTSFLSALYHIEFFEKIADFSRVEFLGRIQPLTRKTWRLRDAKIGSILDGNYLVSSGVERLVLEWKVTRGKWADKRDGMYDEKFLQILMVSCAKQDQHWDQQRLCGGSLRSVTSTITECANLFQVTTSQLTEYRRRAFKSDESS